jgi:hyperosmotically inducible periplasmic protein
VTAHRALALVMLLSLTSGCSLAGRTVGRYVDDKLVKGAVKRRLASEGLGQPGSVRIDTFDGIVYLSGSVQTAEQKSDAEIAAWRVGGVEQVVNDLVVTTAPAVSALPDFGARDSLTERLPGVARVDPGLPGGPALAYDARGRVVASIYTVAWRDLIDAGLSTLSATGRPIDHVSTYALNERPDLPGPHYAVVLWHVSEVEDAAALR